MKFKGTNITALRRLTQSFSSSVNNLLNYQFGRLGFTIYQGFYSGISKANSAVLVSQENTWKLSITNKN
jgi:hypothetical protein